ncbi:amidohydrolase [Boudabousia marimammalium]|uniref:Amidohydrolase n=2 Tax=Boudabousia marimammalium TaxID=156892 RepID=A0A1Q5PSL6_9ACTO|nr:amidohydrolase [Boudabousia marimammalium]
MTKFAITGGKLIDGNGGTPVENSTVLVSDARIEYAGPAHKFGTEYQVIDAAGKTVMPGLIDSHLHFTGNESDDDTQWVLDDVTQKTVIAVQQAHDALESGLTTVGEISRSGVAIRNTINAGIMQGPRMVVTGLGFCRTGGHGDSHKLPLEYNEMSHPWAERVDGPWEIRKAMRRRSREDVDAFKIWATGGGIWRHDDKLLTHYSDEEIQSAVDEAAMINVPVWAHCEGYEGALSAAKAGVHLIIHGQTLNEDCLDIMAEKGIYFCPTIQFLEQWFKTYPPEYNPEQDKYPGETREERELARVYDNLRKADQKGIVLVTGSDSFCSSLTPYGTTLIGEIYSFVEKAGFSPLFAITCATKNGAQMLRVADETGTLEAGKSADLLIIDGDPATNIRDLTRENMHTIMKEGVIVKR